MNIGEEIKKARKGKGLSQRKLAELLGCGEYTVIRWEKGVVKPLSIYRKKLEKVLDVVLKEDSNDFPTNRSPSP